MELHAVVMVFEGKNGFSKDFAVYQLFHPFKYYSMLKKEKKFELEMITCCYILRKIDKGNSILRLYNYTFENEDDMGSMPVFSRLAFKWSLSGGIIKSSSNLILNLYANSIFPYKACKCRSDNHRDYGPFEKLHSCKSG